MRAATWAAMQGRTTAFARSAFRLQFAEGADLADLAVLEAAARDAGLDPAALQPAIADPAVKQRLRDATQAAWDVGVRGIPTLAIGGELHYGDDRLEAAAAPNPADLPLPIVLAPLAGGACDGRARGGRLARPAGSASSPPAT